MKTLRIIAVFSAAVCALLFFSTIASAQKISSFSPSEYDFGDVELGTCEAQVFNFQVGNEGPLSISDITLIADPNGLYPELYTGGSFQITGFPAEFIEEENPFEVEVTFCPAILGAHEAALRIESDESHGLDDIRIPLNGVGIPTNANIKEFNLSGVEIIKGIDIGDVRYGTTFMGKVYEGLTKVGYWWTVIRHTDTKNIEVCGGTNNLLNVKLVVVLNDGSLAGNRMVLGLQDPGIVEDVVWDAMAPICGPACFDEDCACPNNPDFIEYLDVDGGDCDLPMPDDYGPVATIENLELKEKFGSTLNIEEAFLSGWLCHNWAFIPRVAATLTVVLED